MDRSNNSGQASAWVVVALGFSSLTTQIVLLRECLTVFYGNELVIGIVFANWMILTAAGSYLGKFVAPIRSSNAFLIPLFLLLGIIPSATVLALRVLKNAVFIGGNMLSIVQIVAASFILLMPYCVLAGLSFTLLAHVISNDRHSNLVTEVYAWESAGSVIGGLLCNFIFITFLTTFQTLFAVLLIDFIAAFALSSNLPGRFVKYAIPAVCIIAGFFLFRTDVDTLTKGYLFPGQKILSTRDTPFGNLVVTEEGDQKNFFENGTLLSSTDDITLSEESVHYAMIQHPNPKRVLLVSGAVPGTIGEILKYHVERIDFVEVDPWMISLVRQYTTELQHPEVRVINEDPRRYLRTCDVLYDAVLLNVPEPTTAQNNRYYTTEFFQEVKRCMSRDGVMSVNLLENFDYYGPQALSIVSAVDNTLSSLFSNVILIPGSAKDYFLASSQPLSMHIAALMSLRGIPTTYVNQYYIEDTALMERSHRVLSAIDREAGINRDYSPVSYYYQMRFWLSYFESRPWLPLSLAVLGIIAIIARFDVVDVGMFAGGFASSSLELLLIFAFQITFGFIYQVLGIIITIFMAGLAAGSKWRAFIFPNGTFAEFSSLQFLMTLYAFLLPGSFLLLKSGMFSPGIIETIFFSLTFIISILIGMQFSLGASLRVTSVASTASGLYSIDLIGSAVGALVVTTILVPLCGVLTVSFIVASVTLFGAAAAFLKSKSYHFGGT